MNGADEGAHKAPGVWFPGLQPDAATAAQTSATMARAEFAQAYRKQTGDERAKREDTPVFGFQLLGREAVSEADWVEAKGKLPGMGIVSGAAKVPVSHARVTLPKGV